jgi:hypothetical protein
LSKPNYHTVIIEIDELRAIREIAMGIYGRNYLKQIKLKYIKSYQLRYFMRTGRDVHNGRIIKFMRSLKTETKAKINMYNATIEVSDWDLSELCDRLEIRYQNKRFYKLLHRELNDKGYKCTYHSVWRMFNEFRDTSGGKMLDAIKEIVESN